MTRQNPFFRHLTAEVRRLGGLHNAHLHLDRADTLDEAYWRHSEQTGAGSAHVSLAKKHGLIGDIHAGLAYDPADLAQRVNRQLNIMVACNTARADTMVDVTADRVGERALEVLLAIKAERRREIELQVAAYSPFGFVDSEPERWRVFAAGAARADFLGALPEADDTDDYPTHIGFEEHCRRVLELAATLGKPVHVHTDQRNEPSECGTERLLRVMAEMRLPTRGTGEPMVWAVHVISPSTYSEARFEALVEGMLRHNLGVISCPSAALGMRQLRPIATPTYNSIPRLLEMLAAGVHVRLGSDNIADICSPSTTADLQDEIFVLSAALRFYHVPILAKLGVGQALTRDERNLVRAHLEADQAAVAAWLERRGHRDTR